VAENPHIAKCAMCGATGKPSPTIQLTVCVTVFDLLPT
jgi:hypothetical protein